MFKFMCKMNTLLFVCLMMTFAVPALAQNIVTYAGGGPNNTPALAANLNGPNVVGLDSSGNLYIGVVNGKVLRVDKNGVLTLLAGGANNDVDNVPATSADVCVEGGAVDSDGN
ncbi:MAG: hypothetical protein DME61_11310, partial [Verrucomicrobia bacterium]